MLSETAARATLFAFALLSLSCSSTMPWKNEPIGNELNLAFTLHRNLIELSTLRIDDRPGRFILGTAAPRTVIDPDFRPPQPYAALSLGQHETVRIKPRALDLQGVADAIIGSETWRNHAITIDYQKGLVTYQKEGILPGLMSLYRFEAEPKIAVRVDGRELAAIVDTSSPDTLVLPRRSSGRGTAHVSIAGVDFGSIDVRYAHIPHPRIGNRLLSHFLITIDYGQKVVGVWRDPRV